MPRFIVRVAVMAGGVLVLAACAFADSHAPVPAFMRIKSVEPPPPEPLPDVGKLVRENLDAVFVASSNPRQIQVAPPHHVPVGPGWTACVRAELTSATGRPIGAQTYRITISDGVIIDRRHAEASDNCGSESYQPI
jgi:hypothetical protein